MFLHIHFSGSLTRRLSSGLRFRALYYLPEPQCSSKCLHFLKKCTSIFYHKSISNRKGRGRETGLLSLVRMHQIQISSKLFFREHKIDRDKINPYNALAESPPHKYWIFGCIFSFIRFLHAVRQRGLTAELFGLCKNQMTPNLMQITGI